MITIFNGRSRSISGESNSVYAQVDVEMRERLRLFKQGTNLNPWAVFTCLALHANSDGWAFPSTPTIKGETGLSSDSAISSAISHLRQLQIDGKSILRHYRVKNLDGTWGKSYYHIFPENGGAERLPDNVSADLFHVWEPEKIENKQSTPHDTTGGITSHGNSTDGTAGDSLSRTIPEVEPSLEEELNSLAETPSGVPSTHESAPFDKTLDISSKEETPEPAPVEQKSLDIEPDKTPAIQEKIEEPPSSAPPPKGGRKRKERKPWSDLTDAMHDAMPDYVRPDGKPHYGKNDQPSHELYDSGRTAEDVAVYVAWAYEFDSWLRTNGPGGTAIPITMHRVKDKMTSEALTKARQWHSRKTQHNGNSSDNPYLQDAYFSREESTEPEPLLLPERKLEPISDRMLNAWIATTGEYKIQLNAATYNEYFFRTKPIGVDGHRLVLEAAEDYTREKIERFIRVSMTDKINRFFWGLRERTHEWEIKVVVDGDLAYREIENNPAMTSPSSPDRECTGAGARVDYNTERVTGEVG